MQYDSFGCQSRIHHCSLRKLAADCPPSSPTATSAHPPLSASGLRDCDGPWSGVVWGDGPVVGGVGGRGAVGVGLGWALSAGNLRMSPCSSHSYCRFDDPPVWVIMRMLLVVSNTHDPLGKGVLCMSSGIDEGL